MDRYAFARRLRSTLASAAACLLLNALAPAAAQSQAPPSFTHTRHRSLPCSACHDVAREPGALRIRIPTGCTGCHHGTPPMRACTHCHAPAELTRLQESSTSMRMSVWPAPRTRSLPFEHPVHRAVSCTQCHGGPGSVVRKVECAACHADHHLSVRTCTLCHAPRATPVHDRRVHNGCTASGCHSAAAVREVTATRNVCLACHENMRAHEPGQSCASCHVVGPGLRRADE